MLLLWQQITITIKSIITPSLPKALAAVVAEDNDEEDFFCFQQLLLLALMNFLYYCCLFDSTGTSIIGNNIKVMYASVKNILLIH
jgi:hypothetical protein